MLAPALSALLLLSGPAKAQNDPPPVPNPRPVSLVEAAFRDDDGDILMLLSDGPLWIKRKQPYRLEEYPGGVTSHPGPGRGRFDFVDPRLPGQLGTLRVEGGAATASCGARTETLKPMAASEIEGVVDFMEPGKIVRPHYGAPRRLLLSPGKELAFLTLGDEGSLERRLFRVDCDGERCSVNEQDSRSRPGDAGVETLEVRERRGGPLSGTLVDGRDSGKPSSWEEALTGSGLPLKAVPATWAELEKLGVRQADVLGELSTPCDCVAR